MNKKLRQFALLMLTLCFAGSMAFLASADSLADDEQLIGSAWCETCQAETTHLMKGYVKQTCTEPGYSGDIYCSVCRTLLETGTVKEPRHTFEYEGSQFVFEWTESNGTITMTASLKCLFCDETMTDSYSCDYDGSDVISYEVIQSATCDQNEVRRYSIPEAEVDVPSFDFEIPDSKLSTHSYVEGYRWSVTSGSAELYKTSTCSVCGDYQESQVSSEHILSEESSEPEIGTDYHFIVNITRYYLDSDETVNSTHIERLGPYHHITTTPQYVWSGEYGNVTLTRNGTCGYCGATFSEEVPSEEISVANTTLATCTSNGIYTYTYYCSENGENIHYSVEAPNTMLEHADEQHYIWDWEWNGEDYDVSLTINHRCYMCEKLEPEIVDQSLIAKEIIPATCTQNQIVHYYYTENPEYFKELEIPGTQLSHTFGEDGPSSYKWVGAYINGNVTVEATGICKDCGNSFVYDLPYDSISHEYLRTATCQKNDQVRYWVEGHPEIPEHIVDVPDSTVNHSNSYNNGEFVWSYDSSSGQASVKFVANCQWCGTDIEEVWSASLISSEVYENATCIQNQKLRFRAWTDPNSGFTIPDFVVEIPDSKGDHEYGFPHGTWDISADSASMTITYQCEHCDHTYSEIVSSEFITTVTDAEATCENNKLIHYFCTGDFFGNHVSETIEVPDTKLGHEYTATVKYWKATESWNYYFQDEAADWVKVTGLMVSCTRGDFAVLVPIDETFYDVEYQVETCQEDGYWVIPSFTVTYDGEEITVPSTTVTRPKTSCEWDQETLVGYVEPTCTEPGQSGDACCMWCGKVLQPSQELEPRHDYDEDAAVFSWSGYEDTLSLCVTIPCGREGCDHVLEMTMTEEEREEIIESEVIQEASCAGNKIIRYWANTDPNCERIPEYVVEIPNSQTRYHKNVSWVWDFKETFTSDTAATVECVSTMMCLDCNKQIVSNYKTAPVVIECTSAKRPTCTSSGYYTIPEVTGTYTVYLEGGITQQQTVTYKGGTIELPANENDHTHASERSGAVAATCTSNGYTGDLYCTECGKLIEAGKTVAALGHDYGSYYMNTYATCTSDGTATAYCSRCGETETITLTSANGHVPTVLNAKAATCTTDGYTGDTVCNVCHKTLSKGTVISATGHNFTAVDEGYSVCTLCGAEQGSPRLVTVENVEVEVEVAEEQAESAPVASLVVRTTVAAPRTDSTTTAQTAQTTTTSESNVQILTIEYIPELITEDIVSDQQDESELTIKLPAEQVEGYVLYLVKEDGTKIEIPVVYENGKAIFKLNYRLNIQNNWVIRMVPTSQI